ncbi:hypothetical protein LTR22_005176 [Elasticomyces elasticus]|nr:hypothetical protein LTR22_005176 [Elasticomyces elasticus]
MSETKLNTVKSNFHSTSSFSLANKLHSQYFRTTTSQGHYNNAMRFITLIHFAVTALLAVPTCAASLSSVWFPPVTTAIPDIADNCPARGSQISVNITALLPKTNIFEDYKRTVSTTAQIRAFARTAEDIHHRYFVIGSVTNGWPITLSYDAPHILQQVAMELLKLSSLPNLEVLTKSAAGPLPSLQAYYARRLIEKYEHDGNLDADRALILHAAELWSLAHASEVALDAFYSLRQFRYKIPNLQRYIALALQSDDVSSLKVLQTRALLDELSELEKQATSWSPLTWALASRLAHRADNIVMVIRHGYTHEPEPVLQLMRDLVVRGGKHANAAGGRTSNKAWYESMSKGFQQVKGFVGL